VLVISHWLINVNSVFVSKAQLNILGMNVRAIDGSRPLVSVVDYLNHFVFSSKTFSSNN